jgi:hypothetical protein
LCNLNIKKQCVKLRERFIMNSQLESVFSALEKQRLKLLSNVSSLDAEAYHQSLNGKWSVAQILTHLWTSEKMSLGYMRKKSLGIENAGDTGPWEACKVFFLQISQRLPLRYKAPVIVIENTPPAQSPDDLRKSWDALRIELHRFLLEMDDRHLRRKIYKHPVVGRLNIIQALDFFRAHIDHHLPQINRHL